MRTLILLVLLAACSSPRPRAPVVYVRTIGPDATPHADYLNAFYGWSPLGFDFTFDDPGMPECSDTHGWSAGDDPDCEIVVWFERVPGLRASAGTNAETDPETRTISIDASLTGWDLAVASAHEMGHVVLHTGTHTKGGIMGGVDVVMWDVDRALACQSIKVCL